MCEGALLYALNLCWAISLTHSLRHWNNLPRGAVSSPTIFYYLERLDLMALGVPSNLAFRDTVKL